uniref:LasR-specific antiactivator QslA n=1 Tax=Pseudomonas benzenivorans TaxID=556533 RepID=UPI003F7B042E
MNRPCTSHLPTHDGHRGAIIKWPVNCHEAFEQGVASAQAWLSNDDTGWLWANLIIERDALPPGRSAGRSRSASSAGCTSACVRRSAAITRRGRPACSCKPAVDLATDSPPGTPAGSFGAAQQ